MIRKAEKSEYEGIRDFYYQLIDDMAGMEYHPKWQKGVYPSEADLHTALDNSEICIYQEDGKIVAAMRVNHNATGGYEKVAWAVDAAKDEVTLIHILGVSLEHQGKGVAKKMVQHVIDTAREAKQKAIRLDVLMGNIPANRLYESMGFEYKERLSLFYEDTGLTEFDLYELVF